MPNRDIYMLRHEATIVTAITALQIKAGANYGFEILGWEVSQKGSTTSASESMAWVRKSGAATVTTAVAGTHLFRATDTPAADLSLGTTATGVVGSAEGTDADIIHKFGFNVLSGYSRQLLLEERALFRCKLGEIIALKFLTAPATQLWQFNVVLMEI